MWDSSITIETKLGHRPLPFHRQSQGLVVWEMQYWVRNIRKKETSI